MWTTPGLLLLLMGCTSAGRDRIEVVSDPSLYRRFFALGDEYEVIKRVQLLASSDPVLWMRSRRQLPEDMGGIVGYLEPGVRLRVTKIKRTYQEEVDMRRVWPELRVVPTHPYRLPIIPTYIPPAIYGVRGMPTDIAVPDPEYLRKLDRPATVPARPLPPT